jgi:predicted DNA-binding transcriptional regulator AlpA
MRELRPDPLSFPPRGLSREQAARHIGIGATKFDELVKAGTMPRPKRLGGRRVWDRVALEMAFTELPEDEAANPLDLMLAGR